MKRICIIKQDCVIFCIKAILSQRNKYFKLKILLFPFPPGAEENGITVSIIVTWGWGTKDKRK